MNGIGALLGLGVGVGAHLVITAPTPWVGRRVRLRIAAYLDPPRQRDSALARIAGAARLHSIAARQRRAGMPADPTAHLLRAVLAASAGLGAGVVVIGALAFAGMVRKPAAVVVLLAVCGASGWLLAERRLDGAGRARITRAAAELPTLAETLAIGVAAGAALPHAMELAARGPGPLAGECRAALAAVADGAPLDRALAGIAERLPVAGVTRFVDALRIALERGTPIVDVLHAQAADARAESRRLLLERAGRHESLMLVPVVLLVLPAVVLIALFPGFHELAALAGSR